MSQNVQSLFAGAQAGGNIGAAAAQVLAIPDLGAQIQAGLGISVDDVMSSEVLLVAVLLDDSSSIRTAGNEQILREGGNLIIDSLKGSKQSDSVLISVRTLNGTIICPYVPVNQAPKLDDTNYQATGGTPLYRESLVLFGQAVAKSQEFSDNGVTARSVAAIVSDGADLHSGRTHASDVAKVVHDMLMSESHIVIGMGIDDGQTDFKQVYSKMGIEDKWILTPKNTASDIRRAFAVVSQSAVRASQSAKNFSQTSGAGFTT